MKDKNIFDENILKGEAFKTWSQIALLGIILLYAFSKFILPDVNKWGQAGLILCFLYLIVKNPDHMRRDPMCLIFFGVVASQIATWASVAMFHPEISDNALKIDRLGKLFFFVPIAWGLKQRPTWIPIVLLAASAGFIADLFFGSDFFAQISVALKGARVDFGVRNAQHPSMVFGLMVIVSTFYMAVAGKKVQAGMALVFWAIGIAGMVATQTRQTFLGLIVASIVVFITSWFVMRFSVKKMLISIIVIGVLTGTACYSITMSHRQNGVWDTVKVFTDPLPENLESAGENEILAYYISELNQSTGIRVKLWLAMVPYLGQNPLLGWGSSSIEDMVVNNPLLKKENLGAIKHLHNYHLTLYICYGIIGFLLMNGIYVWLLMSSFRIRKRCVNGNEWFLLTVGFVSYWMVINFFENFNGFWTGVFCHNLILGCIYTQYLANKEQQ